MPGEGSGPSTPAPGSAAARARPAGRPRTGPGARFRPNAGGCRCPRRPRELTFTKLSASGKPGSTISPSGLAALVVVGAFGSRGLGGAIFPVLHGSSRETASRRRDGCHRACAKLGYSGDALAASRSWLSSPSPSTRGTLHFLFNLTSHHLDSLVIYGGPGGPINLLFKARLSQARLVPASPAWSGLAQLIDPRSLTSSVFSLATGSSLTAYTGAGIAANYRDTKRHRTPSSPL